MSMYAYETVGAPLLFRLLKLMDTILCDEIGAFKGGENTLSPLKKTRTLNKNGEFYSGGICRFLG